LSALTAEAGDNPLGRALHQFLHEGTGLLGWLGFNQQVKVLWHQNPADQPEAVSGRSSRKTSTKYQRKRSQAKSGLRR
jgi:hypothetical protein